jgi:hypothetical protein
MAPLIRRGDHLTVRPATFSEIQVGDVVVSGLPDEDSEHTLTTHRVVAIRHLPFPHLLTRDDASGWEGAGILVWPEHVYGKVIAIERTDHKLSLDHWTVAWAYWARIKLLRGLDPAKAVIQPVLPLPLCKPLKVVADRVRTFFGKTDSVVPDHTASKPRSKLTAHPSTDAPAPMVNGEALPPQAYIVPHRDVLVIPLADTLYLIPAFEGFVDIDAVYALNAMGVEVWKLLTGKPRIADLVQQITARFDAETVQVQATVEYFIAELLRLRIVQAVA